MKRKFNPPAALAIAGSDCGGGAGLQADLKTFFALQVHGLTVVTAVTAQNPNRILSIRHLPSKNVSDQLKAVSDSFNIRAAKIGMPGSSDALEVISDFFAAHPIPLVIDPVARATSGRTLATKSSRATLQRRLYPRAHLITPNLKEAEDLLGEPIRNEAQFHSAPRRLFEKLGVPILLKGGHFTETKRVTDIFFDGLREFVLEEKWEKNVKTHGTGCIYSAAITAYLAHGLALATAVRRAKTVVSSAIRGAWQVGPYPILQPPLRR